MARDVAFADYAEVNPSRPLIQGHTYPFIEMAAVREGGGGVARIGRRAFKGGGSRFQEGDTLFARITPCTENGKVALAADIPGGGLAFGSTEFIVLAPREGRSTARFVHQLARWERVRRLAVARMLGTSGRQRVPTWFFTDELRIPRFTLVEQSAIAAILDAIDEAIAKAEEAVAATEVLRQALLQELLTRGMPGWHAEWRDVPGLGSVPRCWTMVRLGDAYDVELGKRLSSSARLGVSKRVYLTNRNVKWGRFDLSDVPRMHFDSGELERYRLRSGDLIVCEGGEIGRAAIWQDELTECYYQMALHRLRPRHVGQQPRFLRFLLEHTSKLGFLADNAQKTSIAHLTRETLVRLSLPLPDSHEQSAIAGAIETAGTRIAASREALASLRVLHSRVADALLQGQLRTVNETRRQAAGAK